MTSTDRTDSTDRAVRNHPVLRAVLTHHRELANGVDAACLAVQDAADRLGDVAARRDALVLFMLQEVLPHAGAEEDTLYAAAAPRPETALLVQAMMAEHRMLTEHVNDLARARTPAAMTAGAAAVRALFTAHVAKENDQLLPALVVAGVDLARMLDGMHEILGAHASEHTSQPAQPSGCGCGGCGCSGADEPAAG